MNIIEALQALKDGKKVRKKEWSKDSFLVIVDNILWQSDKPNPLWYFPISAVSLSEDEWEIYEEYKEMAEKDAQRLSARIVDGRYMLDEQYNDAISGLEKIIIDESRKAYGSKEGLSKEDVTSFYEQQVEMNTMQEDRLKKIEHMILVFNEGFKNFQGRIEALEQYRDISSEKIELLENTNKTQIEINKLHIEKILKLESQTEKTKYIFEPNRNLNNGMIADLIFRIEELEKGK